MKQEILFLAFFGTCFVGSHCKTLRDFESLLEYNLEQISLSAGRIPPLKTTVAGASFQLDECAVYFDGCDNIKVNSTTLVYSIDVQTAYGCLYFIKPANSTEVWGEIWSLSSSYLPIAYKFDQVTGTIQAKGQHGDYTGIQMKFNIGCGVPCEPFADVASHHYYDNNVDVVVERVLEKTVSEFNNPPDEHGKFSPRLK